MSKMSNELSKEEEKSEEWKQRREREGGREQKGRKTYEKVIILA